jgi:hypothetical protein
VSQHLTRFLRVIQTTARDDRCRECAEAPLDMTTKVVFAPGLITTSATVRWALVMLRLMVAPEILLQSEGLGALGLHALEP